MLKPIYLVFNLCLEKCSRSDSAIMQATVSQ